MSHHLTGRCHCGNIRVVFETETDPAALQLRACSCSFCRMHGTRTASDPKGRLLFRGRERSIRRYQFGTRTADALLCGNCGVYVGAVIEADGATYGIVNVNVLEDRAPFAREPEAMHYEHESPAERIARRKAKWTPAAVTAAPP